MTHRISTISMFLTIVLFLVESAKVRQNSGGKQALKYLTHGIGNRYGNGVSSENMGLWPSVFNVATKALISVNATCGEGGKEEFCRLSEGTRGRCGVCDNFSTDPGKRHSIHYAIDGTNRWWQSPTLNNGQDYEYVTIDLDLKQVYQVAYVIIKAANAPRPGAWILEKSIDGEHFQPWQYFARYDKECLERYGIAATKGKPHYFTDSDVICTSYYSKMTPMENGEIHTSLVHGRPGANETSPELLEFTKARHVRLKFQGFRMGIEPIPRWLSQDITKEKRFFYSIRDISIGGQCVCNGHAAHCRHNVASGHPECECAHHTCGPNCDRCCPLFNQRQWGPGSSRDARKCLPCNCHGHATRCHYDATVDKAGLSMDINGNKQGGGVCENCTNHTTGVNCEKCTRGYFRALGVAPDAEMPCVKCECDRLGSVGYCVPEGLAAGACDCRAGYSGKKCNKCAPGYRGYPNCEECPCDFRGVVPYNDCENDCTCKAFVEGKNCDHCKSGYFAIRSDNPEGCAACYCSSVTTLCESARIVSRKIEERQDWRICDIAISKIVLPTWDPETNTWLIGNYEIPEVESFYWLAPSDYLGNKLENYGSDLTFKVHWIVMRGDTSGKPTTGPNLILVGANGMKIAYGDEHLTGSNATFKITLHEYNWYHVPSTVKDIITRLRRTEYKGDPVSRFQFLSVLTNIKYVMLRATFHTDQIEGMLETAVLESGQMGEDESYSNVEKCSCPSGYTGLSCESCDYGYVRIVTNTSAHQEQGFCVKCDCNGHSETCNPDTGQCFCEHNTVGEKCERCTHGFYGNPLSGTQNDCQKCACPLMDEENNFSPSCQLDFFNEDEDEVGSYVCTQCPKGYTGDHCELCDDGYFGDPTELLNQCKECSCGGGRCDRFTGQCLGCPGNTEGWRCEKCKNRYFGDPLTADCEACLCDPIGSVLPDCDNITGQCLCKDHFVGRTCDQCELGYGNVTAVCTPCICNEVGSKSKICNTHTGICDCKPGVEGFFCDACQHLHYGFSEAGCQSCNCNSRGSEISTCDITTGQCRCKPNYIGRTCDRCQDGFWESVSGCTKCECDLDGSKANICNQRTGQCDCKLGVGGLQCNTCLPNYYGFSTAGCKACEPCNKKGHMCDPDTGRCVCPAYSHGEYCHICSANTWGYEPNKGCKQCNCSTSGSSKMQCNLNTGECTCRQGFTGFHCNHCSHGYFGYPRCRRCNCNYAGTDRYKARCDKAGVCQCNEDGRCPCKTNVSGQKCDECRDGTFGLHYENPDGCTQCFCFGRSSKCTEAGLTWGQIRVNSSRRLTVGRSEHYFSLNKLETSEKLLIIPDVHGNVSLAPHRFDTPLYWKLHPVFSSDRVLSYGGYLRFTSYTSNPKERLPQEVINHYPLVQLRGQGRIVLEYYPPLPSKSDRHEIRLHESLWKRIYPKDTHLSPRELFMVTLQNVQNIFTKATDYSQFETLVLEDVILDTALEIPGNPPPLAKGVEICECPRQYNSSSCQDPSIGFFRYYTPASVNGTILIDTFIGQARPCECNGRSNTCDTETGYCLHCEHNTDGNYCEKCAEGFYGNPMLPNGICESCPCPSPTKNFAKECTQLPKPNQFICKCKPGYSGAKCDQCSSGYYGQPQIPGGSCQPCDCNIEGRASDECDSETGQCNCKPGVIGKQCSQCEKPRHTLQKFKCTPCDQCTQWLLDDIDSLSHNLHLNTNFLQNGTLQPPWSTLKQLEKRHSFLNDKLAAYLDDKALTEDIIANAGLNELESHLHYLQDNVKTLQPEATVKSGKELLKHAQQITSDIQASKYQLEQLIETLQNFGKSHVSTKEAVKQAREIIREINNIAKRMKYPHKDVLEKCRNIKQLLDKMIAKPTLIPDEQKQQLTNLKHRIKDLEAILLQTEIANNEADLKNRANEIDISKLSSTISNIKKLNENMDEDLTQTKNNINKTKVVLNDAQKNYQLLLNDSEFNELIKKLEQKDEQWSLIDGDKLLGPVFQHVHELEKNATEYAKLFNLSSKEIDALKASEAYGNIKKFLNEAEKAASEAIFEVNTALDTLSPEGTDSVAINTSISLADSERLGIRVKHQKENLATIKQRKDGLTLQVSTLDSSNWNNGLENRAQDNTLRDIKNRLSQLNQEKIEDLINNAIKQTNRIKDIHRTIMDIGISKRYEIDKPLQRLLNLTTSDKLKLLQEQINVTKNELNSIFDRNHTYLDRIKENTIKYAQFKAVNNTVSRKLQQLKAKIESAKKTAEGIRISLAGPTCSRSYMLSTLAPTLLTKLTVKFNYTLTMEPKSGSSLFYLPTSSDQFMNLKIIENVLQFEWKLGQSVNKLEYTFSQNDFYQIDVERIGEHVEMVVTSKDVELTRQISKTEKLENETNIFNSNSLDLLYVGFSPNVQPGVTGCIRDIIYDYHKIGLWNFYNTSEKCSGCIRNNELSLESTYDFYKGDGFSLISKQQQEKYANPGKFNVQFSLRTFDENALLFLAADPERKNYIAITINDGYIEYRVHYPNHEDIVLTTKLKYNNGDKIRVSAEKAWRRDLKQDAAVLKINDEANALQEIRKNIDSSALLRLKKVDYYFGGVPPGYFLSSLGTTSSLHTHESLLGGLEELKEYQLFNDDNIKKYGVVKQTGELEFRTAWFDGVGYVQLQTKQLENKLLFILRTKEANSFIMYLKNSASFALSNGKLNVKLYVSGNTYYLHSQQIINDDEYYLIELLKLKKRVTLKINEIVQDSVKHGEIIDEELAKEMTSLFIGGVPDTLSSVLEGNALFSGGISDMVIDDQIIKYNKATIQTFKNVKIGRSGSHVQKIPKNLQRPDENVTDPNPFNIKDMQSTQGCGTPPNYTFDPNAAKFGDKHNSHVIHFLKEAFWRKDYLLEISFRTLQPNGVLFISFGPKQHFNLLEIKNGKLMFKSNGRRLKEMILPQIVDDGQWYNVIIEVTGIKKKRKLTIAINGYRTKPLRPPKNKLGRELFLGGISANVTLPSVIRSDIHPFSGCIRGLKINRIPQSLVRDKNTIHHNIGQCFPYIEKGSYFGGDAYAIFSKLFHIDKILELSLEFRTTEQNGILLSVSNPRNSPALSIELQNGAIVMTTDNGYGIITNVTNNLSDFALCNNQWHNVTAVYTSTEITINVDGIRKIWVQPDDETLMDKLEAPLYIGGLPDYAPAGTLKMKENFKGCIRNMKIDDQIADWTKMDTVANVLLDSCPMIS